MNPAALLAAMRADSIPEGSSGLWTVRKFAMRFWWEHYGQRIPPGHYTALLRKLDSGGTCVMSDDPPELRKHLDFVLRARGRVLITGLGLGCVLRGVLENPAVTSIDVVEISSSILELVQPHLPRDPRLTVHQADAREFIEDPRRRWDCAWHDLWADRDRGEPCLDVLHTQMLAGLRGRVGWQGALAYPRFFRRLLRAPRSVPIHCLTHESPQEHA